MASPFCILPSQEIVIFFRGFPSFWLMKFGFQSTLKEQFDASKGIVFISFSLKVSIQFPLEPVIFQLPPPKENTV